MSAPSCCQKSGRSDRSSPQAGLARRGLDLASWLVPGTVLALMPKCPACLAAYVALLTGVGVAIRTAAALRIGLIVLCLTALVLLVARWILRLLTRAPGLRPSGGMP